MDLKQQPSSCSADPSPRLLCGLALSLLLSLGAGSAAAAPAQPPQASPTVSTAPSPSRAAAVPDLRAQLKEVTAKGYKVDRSETFDLGARYRVLIGRRPDAPQGTDNRAFFYYDRKFLGTDAPTPSAGLKVVWQKGSTIALQYALYRPEDAACCPTGGDTIVRFHAEGDHLVPLDPIPPSEVREPHAAH